MKKIFKTAGIFACLFMAVFLMNPVQARAGGIWAEVNVRYVILEEDGSWEKCAVEAEEDYLGVSAELTCPDNRKVTNTMDNRDIIWSYRGDGQKLAFGEHRFFLASETDVTNMIPGTYTLTKFDCPKGYEYDNALESQYPLSVTLTQQDITDYVEWASTFYGADGKVYQIYVPVKKIGTESAALRKPEQPQLSVGADNLCVQVEDYAENYETELQYASSKDGGYQTLGSIDGSYYFNTEGTPLKHGETYYFRARYGKPVNGETIYGDFSEPVEAKVVKSLVSGCKPVISVVKDPSLSIIKAAGAGDKDYSVKLAYCTKKNGKYKKLADTFGQQIVLSNIKQLKKGKTYYIKVRFMDNQGSEKIYSSYSKVKKIKIK